MTKPTKGPRARKAPIIRSRGLSRRTMLRGAVGGTLLDARCNNRGHGNHQHADDDGDSSLECLHAVTLPL